MTMFADAVRWGGFDTMLSLFTVATTSIAAEDVSKQARAAPRSSRQYDLEDVDQALAGLITTEIDFTLDALPPQIELTISQMLRAAVELGSRVAWFGFEGSFDFDEILTPEIADQIYGVAGADTVALALDESVRTSTEWASQLSDLRKLVI